MHPGNGTTVLLGTQDPITNLRVQLTNGMDHPLQATMMEGLLQFEFIINYISLFDLAVSYVRY